ncbi:ROK family transcriptional regulator [Nonomuraea sp. NN258]|uniref:ROK family transcriptional regulator n=1 Tax=Nonomuraea antri TaxID=2730852 RepID=UPI0015699180|nr:ROK family transcriptional regulator [Nonomuraea antri]NRQ34130.1 ROK family transcriptional regulator [Nonomuraea antri]
MAASRGVRHDSMRARNLAVALDVIRHRGPLSRAALAEATGLTKTTVSKLVSDLLEAGAVTELGAMRDGERGRPGVAVRLSGHRVAALGLEANIGYLAACVVDLTRSVRVRRTRAVDNRNSRPEAVLAALRDLAEETMAEAGRAGLRLTGAALAVPGPVADGLLRNAPHLGWRDVRVSDLLGLPVQDGCFEVDNEANLAALGELWFGSGATDFLYVSGEIGIGAGLVVDGRVFRGTYGLAGELGHVVVMPEGPSCRCGGRGCLEVYAGRDALLGAADTIDDLVRLLKDGDERALAGCERAGHALGVALTSAVHLMDPGRIVLGGIFAPLSPWLEDPVGQALTARLGGLRGGTPQVTVSEIGADAAVLGAAGLVIQRLLADPARVLGL